MAQTRDGGIVRAPSERSLYMWERFERRKWVTGIASCTSALERKARLAIDLSSSASTLRQWLLWFVYIGDGGDWNSEVNERGVYEISIQRRNSRTKSDCSSVVGPALGSPLRRRAAIVSRISCSLP